MTPYDIHPFAGFGVLQDPEPGPLAPVRGADAHGAAGEVQREVRFVPRLEMDPGRAPRRGPDRPRGGARSVRGDRGGRRVMRCVETFHFAHKSW